MDKVASEKPDEDKPNGSSQNNQKNPVKTVKTGDTSSIFLWSTVGLCAFIYLFFAMKKIKR